MLSNVEKLSIFWDESAIYVLVYGIYALLFCAVLCFVEMKLQRGPDGTLGKLALHNALLAVLAVALFTASMLLSGWYAEFVGGEIASFVITIAGTALAIYFFKAWSIEQLALGYASALLPGIVTAALLVAPYTLAIIFMILLASGMRN